MAWAGTTANGEVAALPAPRRVPDLASRPWPVKRGDPARCVGHAIAAMRQLVSAMATCTTRQPSILMGLSLASVA